VRRLELAFTGPSSRPAAGAVDGVTMGVIVVGVDGSETSRAALRFAFEEAALRDATLRTVHAWQFSYPGTWRLGGGYPVSGLDLDSVRKAADAALEAIVAAVIPDRGEVEVVRRAVEGASGDVLVDESQDAELLVVGSRGLGGFAGILLGSVSQQCAHQAACPVVIIPHRRER
jgi:nucleotide-binding universal stress UspA family protein